TSYTATGCTGGTLSSPNPSKGDTVTVFVTPNDGTANGTTVNDSTSIMNSDPTANVDLPATALTNDTITEVTTSADADGDTVTLGYVWKVTRGTNVCTLTATGSSLDLSVDQTVSSCTGASLSTINPSKGDSVAVYVTPNDGTVNGSTVSDSTDVINSAPTATVDLPATALTNDTITAATTTADADDDTDT